MEKCEVLCMCYTRQKICPLHVSHIINYLIIYMRYTCILQSCRSNALQELVLSSLMHLYYMVYLISSEVNKLKVDPKQYGAKMQFVKEEDGIPELSAAAIKILQKKERRPITS